MAKLALLGAEMFSTKDNGVSKLYTDSLMPGCMETSKDICEQTRQEALTLVKKFEKNHAIADTAEMKQVKALVRQIISELLENEDILSNLSSIKSLDDYTFEHSVNVCLISLMIGIGLSFAMPRLKELGTGALLHDIGKLTIPEEILKKPSRLTVDEFNLIKKHTLYGYEMLKDNKNVSMVSAFIALAHHERYDGSGYPLKLKGDDIHNCARIVAMADVFDAMTSDRVYRRRLHSLEVFEYIGANGKLMFGQDVMNSFMQYIANQKESNLQKICHNPVGK